MIFLAIGHRHKLTGIAISDALMSRKIKNSRKKSRRNSGSPTNQLSVRLGEFRIDLAVQKGRDLLGERHILRVDTVEDELSIVVDGKAYSAEAFGDAVPQVCQSKAKNYMLRFGEYWCMRFRRSRPILMRKRNGLEIIGRLLEAPNTGNLFQRIYQGGRFRQPRP